MQIKLLLKGTANKSALILLLDWFTLQGLRVTDGQTILLKKNNAGQ